MSNVKSGVKNAISANNKDQGKLLDIIRDVQLELGHISDEAVALVADSLKMSKVDVEGVITFYHFFTKNPTGKYTVYLNNSAVAVMMGRDQIAKAFEQETGCSFGMVTGDGQFGLYDTSCIGMNDQEPAAIINGKIFTSLTEDTVKKIVADMKSGKDVSDLIDAYGDGKNQSDLIKAMVNNNIIERGEVLFSEYEAGAALKKAVADASDKIIDAVKVSNIRGRGGAGFPTGMKWNFCKEAEAKKRFVLCNADEGEPGTFKDRVILTEIPEMLFEGMALAGMAINAEEGVLYLRAEYEYLKPYLENVLDEMTAKNLLGKNIAGKKGFNFTIKIQLGAGAYICGEESALIESAEGKRGEPRNRPPFPVQVGYKGYPTVVNNVETYCSVSRIIEKGAEWFAGIGTDQSKGTKVLSVSGDCAKPGIYEVNWGITVAELLQKVGATDTQAVVVGGPSGNIIGKEQYGKKICYSDLGTGGSIIVIGQNRDLLSIVHNFMEFFVEESCGWCVPCRAGNALLLNKLEKIIEGNASELDLKEIEELGNTVKSMSRCGLGQTSPNPILTTLQNMREIYTAKVKPGEDFVTQFDLSAAVQESCEAAGRKPNLKEHE